ncbi:VCBS repeat-containing protein [Pyxidicoccus fallax]|uniref:VCBS repeat-containing protein n=1 Tax=Pyxidicoccus fallax TaxID=394095 RepID=A0A848LU94_9BACT|nr:VCBS repeat-containing protein [Pyxidicoccus fallax]NMO21577.1 VCBS repeat-containing protein [Pyxidicoccus fallax]NPC82815.1 VCBS repeat-containing protein [Pyxidicoccus fallax]
MGWVWLMTGCATEDAPLAGEGTPVLEQHDAPASSPGGSREAATPPVTTDTGAREESAEPSETDVRRSRYLRGTFHAGVAPETLAVGDFNRDGAQDVAVVSVGRSLQSQYRARPGKVSVLLNGGQGALGLPMLQGTLRSTSGQLEAGDLDGDGILDLLAGTRWGAAVLRGQPDGSFQTEDFMLANGVVSSLGILPGTGGAPALGWAVGSHYDGRDFPTGTAAIGFLRPGSGGAFMVTQPTTADGKPLVWMGEEYVVSEVADFNEDGHPDLVMSSSDRPVSLALGSALGPFTFQPVLTTHARALATADFDADGHADILVQDDAALRVYRGDGHGGFTEASATVPPLPVDRFRVVDLNADGAPDLAAVHRGASAVTLWYGQGNGAFRSGGRLAVGREPMDVAVAELDGTGRRELLVAEAGDNTLSVYRLPPPSILEPSTPRACPLRVSAGEAPATPAPLATLATGTRQPNSARGDFDGNGHADIAVVREGGGFTLLLNQGDGNFVTRDVRTDLYMLEMAAGDFNGDGHDDLAAITLDPEDYPYPEYSTLDLLWGNGQGDFPDSTRVSRTGAFGRIHLVAEDLNRDGHLDLVLSVTAYCVPYTRRLLNQGNGQMTGVTLPDLNLEPDDRCSDCFAPAIADFNRDGLPDILYHTVELNLGFTAPDGGNLPVDGFQRNWSHLDYSVGDVDGDGTVDLLTATKGEVDLYVGDGQGTFKAPLRCDVAPAGAVLEARDVNADGIPDLVGVDADARRAVLLLGQGQGTFLPARYYTLAEVPRWVRSMDLLGDARPELVIMTTTGQLTVYPTPEL